MLGLFVFVFVFNTAHKTELHNVILVLHVKRTLKKQKSFIPRCPQSLFVHFLQTGLESMASIRLPHKLPILRCFVFDRQASGKAVDVKEQR